MNKIAVELDESVAWLDTTGKDAQGNPLWRINGNQMQATFEDLCAVAIKCEIPPLPTVLLYSRVAVVAAQKCGLSLGAIQEWMGVIYKQEAAISKGSSET